MPTSIRKCIDQAFFGMKIGDERVVKHFTFKEPQIMGFLGGHHTSHFSTVLMVREKCHKTIKVLCYKNEECLPFENLHDQMTAVKCLRINKILPGHQDFLNAVLSNFEITRIIDEAFEGMILRKEKMAIVRFIEFKEPRLISFPSADNQEVSSVSVRLIRERKMNLIKVMFASQQHESIRFLSHDDKKFAVEFLQKNRIMPTPCDFLDAKSLKNSLGCSTVENMFHGDV
jgi:hypothetical protein